MGIEDQQQEIEILTVTQDIIIPSSPLHISSDCTCVFSNRENNVSELEERSKATTKLCGLIFFYIIFIAVEIVGGIKANSLAILTDAAHLLSDVASCSISLFTLHASGWEATTHHSFGFQRLEILGALLSVQLIWLISGLLIYEAVNRILQDNVNVNGRLMFATATFGFIINLIMVTWIGHHHGCENHRGCENHHEHHNKYEIEDDDHDDNERLCTHNAEDDHTEVRSRSLMKNINVQGAYLHVMADLIQSVGVMIAGAVIWAKPDWLIVDLICTLIFSGLALSTTIAMIKSTLGILMERTPSEVHIVKLRNDLMNLKGVREVHDLHVWAITVGKLVLSCHVRVEPGVEERNLLHRIRECCAERYNIHHATVQIE